MCLNQIYTCKNLVGFHKRNDECSSCESGLMMHTCNPVIWEREARGSEIYNHSQLYSSMETSLEYKRT